MQQVNYSDCNTVPSAAANTVGSGGSVLFSALFCNERTRAKWIFLCIIPCVKYNTDFFVSSSNVQRQYRYTFGLVWLMIVTN
jgi:hypothetical protein